MLNLIGNLFILCGAVFCFIAVLGTIRFKSVLGKIHAATKISTLGCGLILIGTAFHLNNSHNLTDIIFLIFFISLTNPISAHLLGNLIYNPKNRS